MCACVFVSDILSPSSLPHSAALHPITPSSLIRYTALEKSSRERDVWTHDEDLDLLRGYQIYGDKWPLISIFFFPHRCRKELKAR